MRKSLTLIFLLLCSVLASAQVDKKDVRRGNRQFAKAKYGDADSRPITWATTCTARGITPRPASSTSRRCGTFPRHGP